MSELTDVGTERAVLGGVAQYGADGYADVSDLVTTKTFSLDSNQVIWWCLDALYKNGQTAPVDSPTLLAVAHSLGKGNLFEKSEELAHLRAVLNFAPKQANLRKLAGRLKKLEFARQAVVTLEETAASVRQVTGEESVNDILAKIEAPVLDLTATLGERSEGPQPIGTGLADYVTHLREHPVETVGLSTGFARYDRAIGGGFRPGTINVVVARIKQGKSFLAANIGLNVATGLGLVRHWKSAATGGYAHVSSPADVPVLYLDTEMTREDQWARMLALFSGVPIDDVETGRFALTDLKVERVRAAAESLQKVPFDFLSVAGQPFEETEAVMRRWVTRKVKLNDDGTAKPCLIVYDYLKLMTSDAIEAGRLAEHQVLGFMMTRLHNFAVRFKLPVFTFVQSNRHGISEEETDIVSQSDRIAWLCSNLTLFKTQSSEEVAMQPDPENPFNRKLRPLAARHGAGLSDGEYIHVRLDGHLGRVTEGPTNKEGAPDDAGGAIKL
jgi:replicative DNA helicase